MNKLFAYRSHVPEAGLFHAMSEKNGKQFETFFLDSTEVLKLKTNLP